VKEKSSSGDLVSQIDAEAERAIVDGLTAARPHDAILGEEGTDRAGTTGVRWLVDPLDGTANYVTGYPAYAVSIGVEVDGEPAVGVIADSVRGILYSAHRGGGATRDDRPIRPSERTDLRACLIATGFGYSVQERRAQAEIVRHVLPRVADIRRSGSAALDLAAVAAGSVDGFYEVQLAPWDVAAGRVIALEAGARVELLPVEGTDHAATIAAPPQLFDELRLHRPQLMLLDIMMPVMDGWSVLEALQSLPAEDRPRVIVVSARASMRDRAKAVELGADAFVSKPFNVDDLLGVLHSLAEAS